MEASGSGSRKKQKTTKVIHHRSRIPYLAAEVLPNYEEELPPVEERRLEDHTLLQFQGTYEGERCETFMRLDLLQHRTFDWDLMDRMAARARIEALLDERWRRVLACDGPQYRELTVEFHSTWKYDIKEFDSPVCVSFALGRHLFEMSVPQFAVALGFYTQEEVATSEFRRSLRGTAKKAKQFYVVDGHLREFWETISDAPYTAGLVASAIRDPVLRYVHRILACSLIGRRAGADKVNMLDLFCLRSLVERHPTNLAAVFIQSVARPRKGGPEARLDLGPYIGRLAERLGVLERYRPSHLTAGPPTLPYSLLDMRKAGFCPFDDPPRWVEVGAPARRRIPQRAERPPVARPVRAPRAEPLTLEMLRDEMMLRMDLQDRAIRGLYVAQGFEVPDFFREPEAGDDEPDDSDDDAGEE